MPVMIFSSAGVTTICCLTNLLSAISVVYKTALLTATVMTGFPLSIGNVF